MYDGFGYLGLDAPEEVLKAQAEEEAMDEDCYTDEVGGHHDSGMGWAPNGHWCGECCKSSCKDCKVWKAIKNEIERDLNE
jgi:hypothetical protein